MTEPQTTTVTDANTSPTDPGNSGVPQPPVQPVTLPSSGPQTTAAPAFNPEVMDENGRLWRDLYYGTQGGIQSIKNEKARVEGELGQTITSLQQQLLARDGTINGLNQQIQTLQTQVDGIPQLQDQINTLQQTAGLAEKYRILAEYPDVLKIQVQETLEPPEEGLDPIVETVNPIINMVEKSTLDGDELRREINRLSQFYTQQQATPQARPNPNTPPAPPSPAGPAQTGDRTFWYNRAMELQDKLNSGDNAPGLREEYNVAWAKVNELSKEGS